MIRSARFAAVGLLGFAVQIASLWALAGPGGLHYIVATALATELAVLHNFVWHVRWTWRDRAATGAGYVRPLLRFHAANGLTSIAGTVAVTAALTELADLPYLVANGVSVVVCAAANFALADLAVFRAIHAHGNGSLKHFPKRCSVRLEADHREVRMKPDTTHCTEAAIALAGAAREPAYRARCARGRYVPCLDPGVHEEDRHRRPQRERRRAVCAPVADARIRAQPFHPDCGGARRGHSDRVQEAGCGGQRLALGAATSG